MQYQTSLSPPVRNSRGKARNAGTTSAAPSEFREREVAAGESGYNNESSPVKMRRGTVTKSADEAAGSVLQERGAEHGGFDFAKLRLRDASEQRPLQMKGGLPNALKSGVEHLSGIPMDDVRVHYNSSRPRDMKALAYTQGSEIHIAPGQEQHLPHEAWHVAQQKQGRVPATSQINGMPLNADASLEREADLMGARAAGYAGGPARTAGARSAGFLPANSPVQRRSMHDVMVEQDKREGEIGSEKYKGEQYTTVGMEFDIATLEADNILQGVTHVELAHSDFKWNNLTYNLETDAGNVLEFVTPPFFVKTKPPAHLPAADDLRDLIGGLQEGIAGVVKSGETLKQLTEKKGWNGFRIGIWNWKDLEIGWRNWSHRAKTGAEIEAAVGEADTVPSIRIAAVTTTPPQINIAATAAGYHAVADSDRLKPRVEDSPIKETFDDAMAKLGPRVQAIATKVIGEKPDPVKARIGKFVQRMVAVLAQQHAVPYILKTAQQQQLGWAGDASRVGDKAFASISGSASFVKDMENVWLKTDLLSLGLSMLQPEDWPVIRAIAAAVRKNLDLDKSRSPIGKISGSAPREVTDAAVRASMKSVLDQLAEQSKTLVGEGEAAKDKTEFGKAAVALIAATSKKPRAFNEHNPEILGVRQDTFIKPAVMAKLTRELGFSRLLQVMEVRTPTAFLAWLENEQRSTSSGSGSGTGTSGSTSGGTKSGPSTPGTPKKVGEDEQPDADAGGQAAAGPFAQGQVEHWQASCYLNSVLQLMTASPGYRALLDPAANPNVRGGPANLRPDKALLVDIRSVVTQLRTPGVVVPANVVERLIDELVEFGLVDSVEGPRKEASKKVETIVKKEDAQAVAVVSTDVKAALTKLDVKATPAKPGAKSTVTTGSPTSELPAKGSFAKKSKAPPEVRGAQQDAAEVLQKLLERLTENQAASARNFEVRERTTLRPVAAPGEVRNAGPEVPQMMLNLTITDDVDTIQDALRHHTADTEVSVKRNDADAENSPHLQATKFTALPRVLTIALKRFQFDTETGERTKITKPVTAPDELRIPAECLAPALQDEDHDYKLVGFVYHSGASAQHGHYIPYARVPGAGGGGGAPAPDTWESYDDIGGHDKPRAALRESRRDRSYIYTYERIE